MILNQDLKQINISELFFKPVLNISGDLLKQNGYLNTYLFNDEDDMSYRHSVYMLFKPLNLNTFETFLALEEDRGLLIIDSYDYGEYRLVCFNLPPEFNKDYDIILKGKYSKVSKTYKSLFDKFILNNGEKIISLQWLIFNKNECLKTYWEKEFGTVFENEQEYWSLYNIERETFKLNKWKNN